MEIPFEQTTLKKQTLCARIEQDLLDRLERIKKMTGDSVSSIVNEALRKHLIDFEDHLYIFMMFEGGATQTNFMRRSKTLFLRSELPPGETRYPVLTLQVHTPGPFDNAQIAARLLHKTMYGQVGVPHLENNPKRWTIQVDGQEVSPAIMNRFLRRASDDLSLLPVRSFSDVARHKCPRCGISAVGVSGFASPEGFQWIWECSLGHRSKLGDPFALRRIVDPTESVDTGFQRQMMDNHQIST
jgi:Ribbon-helix-helix protein, copG family